MNTYTSKYQQVADLLRADNTSLLDVGCRDGILKSWLPETIKYAGVDLFPGEHVLKTCNVEEGLPFEDGEYDAVAALDLLEHTDSIWFVFDELVRVASKQIMVVLPNMYHWRNRQRFCLGKEQDKYRLTPEPILDRHRWLTSYSASVEFINAMADKHKLKVETSIALDEKPNAARTFAARFFSPNLMSIAAFFNCVKTSRGA